MGYSIDDTQPGAPFAGDPINLRPTIRPDDEGGSRGGCLMTVLTIGMLALVALAIVGLAAAAGWTSGQRAANGNATATQNAAIQDQVSRLPGDVADGNLVLLDTRIRWLATQTPGVPGVSDWMQTATALYLGALPTATPTTAPTVEAVTEEVTEEIEITQESSGGYDLAGILAQAQAAMASSQWQDAIDLLNVILGADPTFQTQTVHSLMSQALTSDAMQLYNANQPAEANLIVDQAEEFGPISGDLSFERYAAELFLTARSAVGTGSPAAISALQAVLNLGQGRYYTQAQQLLYQLYVSQGDTDMAQSNSCSAVGQYQSAINVLPSGVANGKLSAAQNACANATPTPLMTLPPEQGVAPVGVVATPG